MLGVHFQGEPHQATALLLEVMQDPGLEARYLGGVLPLVAQVKVGRTWAEPH